MKICTLTENTVKIVLMPNETEDSQYGVYPADRRKMKNLIVSLLKKPQLAQISADKGRLFAEVFSLSDGGCAIYLSSLDGSPLERESTEKCAFLETDSVKTLLGFAQAADAEIGEDVLYFRESDGVFRLSFSGTAADTMMLAYEFGEVIDGERCCADTDEYFIRVCGGALKKLKEVSDEVFTPGVELQPPCSYHQP